MLPSYWEKNGSNEVTQLMQFFFTFPLRLNTIEISCNILHQWMLSPDRNSMAFFFIIQILFKLLFPKMSLGASFTRGQPRKGASCNSCYIPWCRVGIPLRTQFGRKYFEIELMFFFPVWKLEHFMFYILTCELKKTLIDEIATATTLWSCNSFYKNYLFSV